MNWPEIVIYKDFIHKLALKYSNDADLAEDVAQEVMLKLFEDKKLDTSKFNPKTKEAAIRTCIRNKTLKVLRSRKIGRWQFESLEQLGDAGYQFDDADRIFPPGQKTIEGIATEYYELSDNNIPEPEPRDD